MQTQADILARYNRKLDRSNAIIAKMSEAGQCRAMAARRLEDAASDRRSPKESFWRGCHKAELSDARAYRRRAAFMGFKLP